MNDRHSAKQTRRVRASQSAREAAFPRVDVRWLEGAVLLVLGFELMKGVTDLTRVAQYFLGFSVSSDVFAIVNPLEPLLRGIIGVTIFVYLVRLSLARRRGRDVLLGVLLWSLIAINLTARPAKDMFVRATVDEVEGNRGPYASRTHDGGVLQTEVAMDYVASGLNPYVVDYGRTKMARARDSDPRQWQQVLGYERNPALGHVPYLPTMFVAPIPLRAMSKGLFDWYDQRLFYILAAFVFLIVVTLLAPRGSPGRLLLALAGLSPPLMDFLTVGRNDVVLMMLLGLMALDLRRRQSSRAGVWLGLACAAKQFAWPASLAVGIYLWRHPRFGSGPARRCLGWACAVFCALCLPFFIDDPGAMVNDVLAFNLGLTDDAYPLRPDSLGLASLVLGTGMASELRHGFPMWIFQLTLTVPLTIVWSRRLWRQPTLANTLATTALIVFTALFASAFFALNYWGVPLALFLLAFLTLRPIRPIRWEALDATRGPR